MKKVKGRVPVVIGTAAMLTSESNDLATAARDMGADAILLASPPCSVPMDRENALNALAIDKAADLPIMLYKDPHIQLGCGMDDQALEFFAWGAPFGVCGGANFLPAEHVALYNACVVEGNFAKGRRVMSAMMPLMRVLEQGGKFIQTIKHGVTMNGIDCSVVRTPLEGLNRDEMRAFEDVVHVLTRTIAEIQAEGGN